MGRRTALRLRAELEWRMRLSREAAEAFMALSDRQLEAGLLPWPAYLTRTGALYALRWLDSVADTPLEGWEIIYDDPSPSLPHAEKGGQRLDLYTGYVAGTGERVLLEALVTLWNDLDFRGRALG